MDASISFYELFGIPNEIGIILFMVALAMMLVPFFSGFNLGFISVPDLGDIAKRRLKYFGVPLVIISTMPFFPIFEVNKDEIGLSQNEVERYPVREYFFGTWRTSNFERGLEVELFWTIKADGTTSYIARVGGEELQLVSNWSYANGLFYEENELGTSKSRVETIDKDTFKLTIVEDETAAFDSRGVTRIYQRVGE